MVRAKYEITAEDKTRAALNSAKRGLSDVRSAALSLSGALAGLGAAFSIKAVIDATVRQEQALRQVEARIKSTGGAAGFSRDQIAGMATALQSVTTFGDEAILEMQSVLMTFTRVTGDVFAQASESVLDMATAMGTDAKSAALQLGKALNDPIAGLGSLSRAGVQFTDTQRRMIQQMVQAGDVAGAQRVILAELQTQFGGAARAARDTFGGALTGLKNAFSDLLEADGGGLTDAKAALEELTRLLSDPATIAAANALTTALINGFKGAAEAITTFVGIARMMGENLARSIHGAADPIERVDDQIQALQARMQDLQADLDRPRLLRINPFESTGGLARELLEARIELTRLQALRQSIIDMSRGTPAPPPPATAGSPGAALGGTGTALALPGVDTSRALLERHTALLKDALARQLADLELAHKDGLTSTAAYFMERARLQEQALDADLKRLRAQLDESVRAEREAAGARAAAATDAEARSATAALVRAKEQQIQLTGQITIMERDRAAIAARAARDQAAAEGELAEALDRVRIRLLELTGQSAEARRLALEREFASLITRLQAEGDAQGEAMVRKLLGIEQARAALDDLERQVTAAMQRMSTAEQSIGVQQQAGLLNEIQARQQIVALHQQTAAEVEQLIPRMLELAAATGDPAALDRVRQLAVELQRLTVVIDDVALRINGAVERGLGDMFSDIATGVKTAEDAFRDFARTIINEIARIASQKLATQILGSFGGGGAGGLGGFISGMLKHSGGLVSAGGPRRTIPAFHFATAPRLHDGGLLPGEVPAILRNDEEVLTRDDPRHQLNGGGGTKIRMVVVDDQRRVGDYISSAEGEQVLIRTLTRAGFGPQGA